MAPAFPWTQNAATLEHVFPQRRGGKDGTCVAVHAKCNSNKGHRPPTGCELLALDCVRTKVLASPRLVALIRHALEVVGGAPAWATFGQIRACRCSECQTLDARFPDEGQQLLLPVIRH